MHDTVHEIPEAPSDSTRRSARRARLGLDEIDADLIRLAVREQLASLDVAAPLRCGRLTVYPLVGPSTYDPSYVVYGPERSDDVEIDEISDAGAVPSLRIRNTTTERLLVLDTMTLIGSKQNRMMDRDLLVPAKTAVVADVTCVEAGRWSRARTRSVYGGFAASFVRSAKSSSRARATTRDANVSASQREVWSAVSRVLHSRCASSPSSALHAAFEKHEASLREARHSLTLPIDAVGVLAVRDGQFDGLDLFDRASTLAARWDDLADSYLLESLDVELGSSESPPAPDVNAIDSFDPAAVLGQLDTLTWKCADSPGLGTDILATRDDLVASGLVYEGDTVVHLRRCRNGPRRRCPRPVTRSGV